MRPITDFMNSIHAQIQLDEALLVKKKDRYYLLNDKLKKLVSRDFFHAGTYLGKTKDGTFFPSFALLTQIAEGKANKVMVGDRAEWLFICGRDIFARGITEVIGSGRKGGYTLVMNKHGECLGFGRIAGNLQAKSNVVAVKNISDVGDFLRRERRRA